MKNLLNIRLTTFLFSLFLGHVAFGQLKTEMTPLYTPYQGAEVEIGQPTAQLSVNVAIPGSNQTDFLVLNRLVLGVDIHYPEYFATPMEVKVKLDVQRWDVMNTQLPDTTIYLELFYNPFTDTTYISKQTANFKNAYSYNAVIDSIYIDGVSANILPHNLFIHGEILLNRRTAYVSPENLIAFSSILPLDKNCDTLIDGIQLNWADASALGVLEYQLEWLHINDYGDDPLNASQILSANALNYNFKYNSTRISTSETSYDLGLIFDQGWLVFRLRGVGVNANGELIFGEWNTLQSGAVANVVSTSKYQITDNNRHENTLNWQYSATYAEEGKKKEVISYFDGSLRNRQTATRINSDQNVIVGETIYDHQGRPAINVLPVPVIDPECQQQNPDKEAVLKFYANFNKNLNEQAYSRLDFDVDDALLECTIGAAPMSTSSGASNYYSPANPDQNGFQAYVPDAKKYPFVQVEYTPDNTGRIRRQSGVGEEFQLEGGHESRYYYGQPNQLELDRLFGAEVGDAKHYKKNVVIDANGQVSISYMDQEGRVIATALAGDAPTNLEALESEQDAAVTLTVDAFGESDEMNSLNIEGDALTFSTQLNVSNVSHYTFSYDFNIAPLQDECLATLCIDCVYDLTIELVDECGVDLIAPQVQQMVGKFSGDAVNGYTFHAVCTAPLDGTPGINSILVENVAPGSYSLNKVLRINEQARQAYIDVYTDTLVNDCIFTFNDFLQAELDALDFSDCFIDCETCYAELGTLEDFVAEGYGTANDYYLRVEDCERACDDTPPSVCEIIYSQLRMDMAPGGQYGEFPVSNPPMTTFNLSNLLPDPNAYWRNPKMSTPFGDANFYADENGDTSRIYLSLNPLGDWQPAPFAGTTIKFEPLQQQSYIYAEELNSTADFVDNFIYSWTLSLVTYHPEYCYYETCARYGQEALPGDAFTSDGFDAELLGATTFQEAITAGFLTNQNNVTNWFTSGSPIWDPFVVRASEFATADCQGFGAMLSNRFNNYLEIDGQMRTMAQAAAYAARCNTNFFSNVPSSCFNFGGTHNGVMNTDILDMEWNILKSFYRSVKQEIMQELADCIALNDCNAYCGCIGNEDYNPILSGMMSTGGIGFFNAPFFDPNQPCGFVNYTHYQNKQRRFTTPNLSVPIQNANEAAYEIYLATGQCPVPFILEHLLSDIAGNQQLTTSGVLLNDYPMLNALFQADNDFNMPGTIPTLNQIVTISVTTLTSQWVETPGNTVYATLTLQLPAGAPVGFGDITNFANLYPTFGNGFQVEAVYVDIDGNNQTFVMAGTITTFNIQGCSFGEVCNQSELERDLELLMSNLAVTGNFTSTTPIIIDPLVFQSNSINGLQTALVSAAAGTSDPLRWEQITSTEYRLASSLMGANEGLFIEFTGPNSFNFNQIGNVIFFSDLNSAGDHLFTMKAHLNNQTVVELNGKIIRNLNGQETGIPVGDCGLPIPVECQTAEHYAFESLENLLKEALENQGLTTNTNVNLFESIHLNSHLQEQFDFGLQATSSTFLNNELTIHAGNCEIQLATEDTLLKLDNVLSILSMEVSGATDINFNYQNFELTALFATPGGNVIGQIFGTSDCLSLQECFGCIPSALTEQELDTLRTNRLASGEYYIEDSHIRYGEYLTTINEFNTLHNLEAGDSLFVDVKSYEYFAENGFNFPLESYRNFIQNAVVEIDDIVLIKEPETFVANYGFGVNVNKEYGRYQQGISRYNTRAQQQGANTLGALSRNDFIDAQVAAGNGEFVLYLEGMPQVGQTTLNIIDFLNLQQGGGTIEQQLYGAYVNAWKQFESNQIAQNGTICFDFMNFHPLYSFEDVVTNNLFCTTEGQQLFQEYIDELTSGDCPGLFPELNGCNPSQLRKLETRGEQKLYMLYLDAIHSFNASFWADTNNVQLQDAFGSLPEFIVATRRRRPCIELYVEYLAPYKNSTNANFPAIHPVGILFFGPCNEQMEPEVPCSDEYVEYQLCVRRFNTWAFNNGSTRIDQLVKFEEFVDQRLCYCLNTFCSRLEQVMDSLVTFNSDAEFYRFIDFRTVCEKPCQPEQQEGIFPEMVADTIYDDCIEMLLASANLNAQFHYENYMDSLVGGLYNQYTDHCMAVEETMSYTYTSKLYHFTLYYYDQAGNLIKTIPPAGVEQLPTTNSNDALSMKIAADRANHTKTVFTNHRLATRYEYNSLNQLVAQSTPDTDNMDIFELSLTAGLHPELTTRKIQMVNENVGYLVGDVAAGTTIRGYMYKTLDGGVTWTRIYNLPGTHLKNAVMVDATTGFAIGTDGIVLKTIDGGETWDMLNSWVTPGTGMIVDLNAIHSTQISGQPTVLITGNNGLIAQTTDFETFTIVNNGIPSTVHLSGITDDGQELYVTANDPQTGVATIYTRALTGTNWTLLDDFLQPTMLTVDNPASNRLIMAGENGRIYSNEDLTNSQERWKLVETNLTGAISHIKYFDNNRAIALVDGLPYRTINGGETWHEAGTESYHHLSKSADGASVLAVGTDGEMGIFVTTGLSFAPIVDVNHNLGTATIQAGWINRYTSGIAQQNSLVIVASGNALHYTPNATQPYPVWSVLDLTAELNGAQVKSIAAHQFMNTSTWRALLLTTDGKLIKVYRNAFNALITSILDPTQTFELLDASPNASLGAVLRTDGRIFEHAINADNTTLTERAMGVPINFSAMVYRASHVQLVGDPLHHVAFNGGGPAIQNDQTGQTNPLQLNDITSNGTNVLAVGNNAVAYQLTNNQWKMLTPAVRNNFNATATQSSLYWIAGDKGYLASLNTLSQFQSKSLTTGGLTQDGVTEDLYDVAVNGTAVYAVGENGRVLYSPNGAMLSFAKLDQGTRTLYGVTPNGTNMLAVGEHSTVMTLNIANYTLHRELFTPGFVDVHFISSTRGTVLGEDFTLRRTTDAGQTWSTVVPQNTAQAPTADYTTVWTTAANTAVVLGAGAGYAITGNQATLNASLPTDVKAATRIGSNLYAVSTSNIHKIAIPALTSSNIASFTGTARTIQAHPSGGFAVAGESGLFRYYNSSETFVFSENIGTENINALAFIDNTYAVAVGDNGAYYKSTNAQVDAQGNLTGLNWQQKTGVFTADPYQVNAANQVNIHTIAFATATNAVFGGEYTVNFTTNPITQAYVRTLFDPNSRYANRFFYDKLGRLVVSQNARQFNLEDVFQNPKDRKYSYTLYDGLGRVVEVGEKTENTTTADHFSSVFGTQVSGYYNPSVMDDAKLLAWINGDGPRKEVTKSYYDETLITGLPGDFTPNVLTQRKRIVHVTYEEEFDGNDQTFDHATHYDYDIHGNVKTLLQDNRKMAQDFASIATQRFKRMDYTYDLVSGNVHRMSVTSTGSATASNADQWHHAYKYDADNRITHAYTNDQTPLLTSTSSATVLPQALENELTQNADWQQEASYFYYAHGPLARTEIGQDELQGCDYIYNLQGWMKGVNSTSLDETIDPGKDASTSLGNLNGNFAKDVYGFSLHYYEGDYLAINGTGQNHAASINSTSHAALNATTNDLFNGNIRFMQTAITNPDTRDAMPMLNVYQYDQLNRLLESRSYETGLSNNVWNPTGYNNEYFNAFTFDPNGNIKTQKRHLRDGTQVEDMSYKYKQTADGKLLRNRLYSINDWIDENVATNDIDDMDGDITQDLFDPLDPNIETSNNYIRDEEGRLIRNIQEEIEEIVWRVDGKVKEVRRFSTSQLKNVIFDYDAMGNQIAKHIVNNQTGILEKSTYYILDASGNQMSVYEHEVDAQDVTYTLAERQIYGSSHVGTLKTSVDMYNATQSNLVATELGHKRYSLGDHRGNVNAVISDIKIPVATGTTVDYFDVYIVNVADFSPFNVELDGRTIKNDFYRYSVQGQEGHDEILGEGNYINYKYRGYDPRVGRLDWRVDPLSSSYPHNSPYAFSENRVLDGVELEGLEWAPYDSKGQKVDINSENWQQKVTDYVWKGFDQDHSPMQGTVAEAQVIKYFNISTDPGGGFEFVKYFGTNSDGTPIEKSLVRAPWLLTARRELGTQEIKGSKHNPRIIEYHNTTLYPPNNDDDKTGMWCASYCNWVMKNSGYENETGNSAWTLYWSTNYKKNNMTKYTSPVYGSVVIFKWTKMSGHAGFVVGADDDGGIWVLGGNQGDEVNIRYYGAAKVKKAQGFFVPNSYTPTPIDLRGGDMEGNYFIDRYNIKSGTNDR